MYRRGATMTKPYHFDTKDAGFRSPVRLRSRSWSRSEQEERRARRKLNSAMREVASLQATIADLERGMHALQFSIDAELAGATLRDPSEPGYPVTARALAARRDNLKITIATLSQRLAGLTGTDSKVDRSG
jgi:hypothetical protein